MPEMTVIVPGDGVEVRAAVFAAADYGAPVYLRLTRDPSPVVFGDDYRFRIGAAVTVWEGADISVMTTDLMLPRALAAAETLAAEGVQVHLLHSPTVKPQDVQAVVAAAERTGLVVTAEEHSMLGVWAGPWPMCWVSTAPPSCVRWVFAAYSANRRRTTSCWQSSDAPPRTWRGPVGS
jgi:transketolase